MKVVTKNKRAYFDYEFSSDYTAGIVLAWHEVKSIKTSHVNIQDTVVSIQNWEIFILGMDVPLYSKTSPNLAPHYQPKQKRKLLLNKKELSKIAAQLDKPWMTAVALEVLITDRWFIKIKIWIGRLKKKIEKKQILKERSQEKEMRKEAKLFR